jgi:hypothetical protein
MWNAISVYFVVQEECAKYCSAAMIELQKSMKYELMFFSNIDERIGT